MATTAATPAPHPEPARWTIAFRGVRFRILFWYILLLGLALFISVSALRQLLLVRLDERIDRALTQEIEEFEQLAGGIDPATGEPFGDDVEAIFSTFFARSVPDRNEVYLAITGTRPTLITATAPYRIDNLPEAVAAWAAVPEPAWATIETPEGQLRSLAVPVTSGDSRLGTLVVAYFLDPERAELTSTIRLAAIIAAGVLLAASAIAWFVSGRILAPLRQLGHTARAISDTDLSARIAVKGDDEIASLAQTFNSMLDRLETSFSLQRRFLDEIGHELHTPITVIRGHLEVAGDDPDEQRESRAVVIDELARMQRLVDDLLILARSERPDFLLLAPVQLADLTDEILARSTVLAERSWHLDAVADGVITGDRQRLLQAAMNLVQNAVRYTDPGTTIAIGSDITLDEARIWVRDTGPGIDPADHERIFTRFVRGRQDSSEGSGLGLAIVRAIAEAHHGRVELESAPGQGATFTIVIPIAPEDPR